MVCECGTPVACLSLRCYVGCDFDRPFSLRVDFAFVVVVCVCCIVVGSRGVGARCVL